MRIVILIALLIILSICTLVHGDEALSVSGDFGRAWLKSQLSEPEPVNSNETSGLWNWGGVPKGYKAVNGALKLDTTVESESNYYESIWMSPFQEPLVLNNSAKLQRNDLSPFYSDDPWMLAQHYERPVSVPSDY